MPNSMIKLKDYFTNIYNKNVWRGKESRSGKGSDLEATFVLRIELVELLNLLGIKTILDAACGDTNWISTIWNRLNLKEYIGMDIVESLIHTNRVKHHKIKFIIGNIVEDKLPKVDLILCRDCLVHFSYATAKKTLQNFVNSESTYLLTTHFTSKDRLYPDINDGNWRAINFTKAPFYFPEPISKINEECKEGNGVWRDKHLALWKLVDIKDKICGG